MTIDLAGLKATLADVPGIASLTETTVGGRRVYGFNGLVAAVDMNSDEATVEHAIRNAAAMRASGQVAAVAPAPAPQTAAPNAAPPSPAPTQIPQVAITPAPATSKSMSITGAAPAALSIKQIVDQARQSVGAAHDKLRANAAKVQQAADALSGLGDDLGKEGDDLFAMVGQYKNDLGAS